MIKLCRKRIDLIALQILRVLPYEGGLTGFQIGKAIQERRGGRLLPSVARIYRAVYGLEERRCIEHGVSTTTADGESRKTWVRRSVR